MGLAPPSFWLIIMRCRAVGSFLGTVKRPWGLWWRVVGWRIWLPKSSWQVASIERVSASGALEWEVGCD